MATAEAIGLQILATLRAQAARNRQAADELRDEIRAVLCAQPDPAVLTARQVRALLTVAPLPSLRTVQDHLKHIRAVSSVSRDELAQTGTHGR